jgi:4-hydroxybenzoate polyprenyltransferase
MTQELEDPQRTPPTSTDLSEGNTTNIETPIDTTPLCVDLDGTLIQSDLSVESTLKAIKLRPWVIIFFPLWLRKGLGYFKSQLARFVRLNYATIPLNQSVLNYIKEKKEAGRPLLLVTGSYQVYARSIAEEIGIFDEVLATTDTCNLTGRNKARILVERFGEGNFDYIGNEVKDQHIWQVSRRALFANATPKLIDKLSFIDFYRVFHAEETSLRLLLKACRANQWVKNLLLFVAPLITHTLFEGGALISLVLAFISFSLLASATYLFNDFCDLEADRKHPQKSKRPLASGALPIRMGVVLMTALFCASFVISLTLPYAFSVALLTYLALTLAYSLQIKKIAGLDVLTIAVLYTIRIVAGALALSAMISFWLLSFSVLLFLSVALSKRVSDLIQLAARDGTKMKGRDYSVDDQAILTQCGTASGYLAVFILAMYLHSPKIAAHYAMPQVLWLLCPALLYWITRTWIQTARGQLREDPFVSGAKDKISLSIGAFCIAVFLFAGLL